MQFRYNRYYAVFLLDKLWLNHQNQESERRHNKPKSIDLIDWLAARFRSTF